jgi:NADH:ubiquinone oxidoreductase subunit 6 (subunit J)
VFQTQAAPAAIAAIIVAVLVSVAAAGTNWGAVSVAAVRVATKDLANLLFGNYVLAFEAVSVLLLAAVIGGVFLAKREKDAS